MKTLVTVPYGVSILVEGDPAPLVTALSRAEVVEIKSGYGRDVVFAPSKDSVKIEFLPEVQAEPALMQLVNQKDTELNNERSKRYAAERELTKIKKQFSLE